MVELCELYGTRARAAFERLLQATREFRALQQRVAEYDLQRRQPAGGSWSQGAPTTSGAAPKACYRCALSGAKMLQGALLRLVEDPPGARAALDAGLAGELARASARAATPELRAGCCDLLRALAAHRPGALSQVLRPVLSRAAFAVRSHEGLCVRAVVSGDVPVFRSLAHLALGGAAPAAAAGGPGEGLLEELAALVAEAAEVAAGTRPSPPASRCRTSRSCAACSP